MAVYVLEEAPSIPESPRPRSEVRGLSAQEQEGLVLNRLRDEVDTWYLAIRSFDMADPSEIFMQLAGFSARAAEIRSQLQRSDNRKLTAFRTRELDPFLEEVDRQFKLWSRAQACREMEARLTGGFA